MTVTVWRLRISSGVEYSPLDEMLPTFGLNDQLTAVFEVLETVALNCCCCSNVRVTLAGLTVTVITSTFKEKVLVAPFRVADNWTVALLLAAVTFTVKLA
jgi:hypothetical protein